VRRVGERGKNSKRLRGRAGKEGLRRNSSTVEGGGVGKERSILLRRK
jgi:hypothetical protein